MVEQAGGVTATRLTQYERSADDPCCSSGRVRVCGAAPDCAGNFSDCRACDEADAYIALDARILGSHPVRHVPSSGNGQDRRDIVRVVRRDPAAAQTTAASAE